MAEYTSDLFLKALRERRVRYLRGIRFKDNQRVLLSLSKDGVTLNVHRCFRHAPDDVMNAIATFLLVRSTAPEYGLALRRIRSWPARLGSRRTGRTGFKARPPKRRIAPKPGPCAGTPAQRQWLWRVFARLNQSHFGGRLPVDVPIRLSARMRRRYGQMAYYEHPDGTRIVVELALNLDLMVEGNEGELYDTLLHEMAHMEAWLFHGDPGHGPLWKEIAERVGCEALACTSRRIRRRSRRTGALTRIPRLRAAA